MAPIYSTKFLEAASFSGAVSYRYTVPDGYVAVVKSITMVWGDVSVDGLDCWLQSDSLAKLVRVSIPTLSSDPLVNGGDHVRWGSWVLEAGQQLGIATGYGTIDAWAGGYLLSLP